MQHAQANTCKSIAQIEWILGSWQKVTDKKLFDEQWTRVSADTFEGIGTVTDILSNAMTGESMRIVQMQQQVFYLAKVSHNPLPIAFKATECLPHEVTFINTDHDFPNSLTYRRVESELIVDVKDNNQSGFTLRFREKN